MVAHVGTDDAAAGGPRTVNPRVHRKHWAPSLGSGGCVGYPLATTPAYPECSHVEVP